MEPGVEPGFIFHFHFQSFREADPSTKVVLEKVKADMSMKYNIYDIFLMKKENYVNFFGQAGFSDDPEIHQTKISVWHNKIWEALFCVSFPRLQVEFSSKYRLLTYQCSSIYPHDCVCDCFYLFK